MLVSAAEFEAEEEERFVVLCWFALLLDLLRRLFSPELEELPDRELSGRPLCWLPPTERKILPEDGGPLPP